MREKAAAEAKQAARAALVKGLETGLLPAMDEGGFILDYLFPDRHAAGADGRDGT